MQKKQLYRILAALCILGICTNQVYSQVPQSSHYKIVNYGFGAGGTASSSSTTYSLNGIAGEVETASQSSTNFTVHGGLNEELMANVPPAPSFTNAASNYDRLLLKISTGNNPSDAEYAVAISTDNFFSDIRYIQPDFTIGTGWGPTNFMSYTTWGGSSGQYITGLANNKTYYVKVKARQGAFTESQWGPESAATTSDPILTFGIDSSSINFTPIDASNSYTDAAKSSVLTTTTNAYNGYVIYGKVTQQLTATTGKTISNYSSPNSSPTTWSGTGFGYTTNDTNLVAGTGGVNRFASGTKYAGFVTSGNGDPVADHESTIVNPTVSNEQFTISYRLTGDATTAAGTYQTKVEYIIVPSY